MKIYVYSFYVQKSQHMEPAYMLVSIFVNKYILSSNGNVFNCKGTKLCHVEESR